MIFLYFEKNNGKCGARFGHVVPKAWGKAGLGARVVALQIVPPYIYIYMALGFLAVGQFAVKNKK